MSKLKVVDVYSDNCGPCKLLSPIIDELKVDMADVCDIVKVDANTDEGKEYVTTHNIRGVPTLLFMKDDAVVASHVGTILKNDLVARINSLA